MIAKFDNIPGENLTALLTFIHGDENQVTIFRPDHHPPQYEKLMIVRIKAVNPDNLDCGKWYGLTLDILEWLPKESGAGLNRVDPKYLLKVYKILGQNRTSTEKYPPISAGTKVKTTQPNMAFRKKWTDEAWGKRKWDIQGTVDTHHEAHGLFYEVRHEDGTEGFYDPSELKIVQQ